MRKLSMEHKAFVLILTLVTIAFFWILFPFYGAILWAVILAIIFNPLQRRLRARMRNRNLASLISLFVCVVIAVVPVIIIVASVAQQVVWLYQQISTGRIDFGAYANQIQQAIPASVHSALNSLGVGDLDSLRQRLSQAALAGSQFIANRALNIGQVTFQFVIQFFVMLYLLFFLFRDGPMLVNRIRDAVPLEDGRKHQLAEKFTTVLRATVKGNIIVAITQGVLGGLAFWFFGIQGALLWGVLMAVLSLLPAVGAGLVWGPVAIYFLVSGATWQGVALIVYGVLVIGLVDNVLRPILVGKDTKLPDYIVLISTLGGMALMGLNGFVIGPLVAALFIAIWALFAKSPDDQSTPSVPDGASTTTSVARRAVKDGREEVVVVSQKIE
ncbi:AI-2E family transporter [Verticiella sediminum]|uniref:AI-2E family transporter n=1 Tax=Verticiella sediminum TaxID=1247510 RepID=A0A556ABJ7_9BURK|nr:AI-2E family transporter [Verticiella sediminum]TSH90264.1 AI-2E family transporter [Verticiella sediminum]